MQHLRRTSPCPGGPRGKTRLPWAPWCGWPRVSTCGPHDGQEVGPWGRSSREHGEAGCAATGGRDWRGAFRGARQHQPAPDRPAPLPAEPGPGGALLSTAGGARTAPQSLCRDGQRGGGPGGPRCRLALRCGQGSLSQGAGRGEAGRRGQNVSSWYQRDTALRTAVFQSHDSMTGNSKRRSQ